MKTPPIDKRALLLVAVMVLIVPEAWVLTAGQGAKTSAETDVPLLVIGVFQAFLLGLYVVGTVRSKPAKWLVAIFVLIGVGGGVWWAVRTDPADEEAIHAISLAQSACTSNGSNIDRRKLHAEKLHAEAVIAKVRDDIRQQELSNQLHNALLYCE